MTSVVSGEKEMEVEEEGVDLEQLIAHLTRLVKNGKKNMSKDTLVAK